MSYLVAVVRIGCAPRRRALVRVRAVRPREDGVGTVADAAAWPYRRLIGPAGRPKNSENRARHSPVSSQGSWEESQAFRTIDVSTNARGRHRRPSLL